MRCTGYTINNHQCKRQARDGYVTCLDHGHHRKKRRKARKSKRATSRDGGITIRFHKGGTIIKPTSKHPRRKGESALDYDLRMIDVIAKEMIKEGKLKKSDWR